MEQEKINQIRKLVKEKILANKWERKVNKELVENINNLREEDIDVRFVTCNYAFCELVVNYTSEGRTSYQENRDTLYRTINPEKSLGNVFYLIDEQDKETFSNWLLNDFSKIVFNEYIAKSYLKCGKTEYIQEQVYSRTLNDAKTYFSRLNMETSSFNTRVNDYSLNQKEIGSVHGYYFSTEVKYDKGKNHKLIYGHIFEGKDGDLKLVFSNTDLDNRLNTPECKNYAKRRILTKILKILIVIALIIIIYIIIGIR